MSNYRAIAAVTIALRHLLAGAVTDTENFTISRPDDRNRDQQNETGINIFTMAPRTERPRKSYTVFSATSSIRFALNIREIMLKQKIICKMLL